MNRAFLNRCVVAAAVTAAAGTFGRDALACGGCPNTCSQSDTQDVFFNGQFYVAEAWKDFNAGRFDSSGVFFQTGFDGSNNAGFFTVQPFQSNILCVDAEGFQDGSAVAGCFQECDTGNFGDGGSCTGFTFEDPSCVNNDTGFGPPSNFFFDVAACNC